MELTYLVHFHNGGCHSSFWGIIKKTPLGGTIHWLSPDLDCGSVISQKTFYDDGVMSADFIRTRQRAICAELFEENIDDLIAGKLKPGQDVKCDFHKKSDIVEATTFDINDTLTAEQFMLLGRATHHGDRNIHEIKRHKKYKLSVNVEEFINEISFMKVSIYLDRQYLQIRNTSKIDDLMMRGAFILRPEVNELEEALSIIKCSKLCWGK